MQYTPEELQKLSDSEVERLVHDIAFPKGSEYDDFFHGLNPCLYCQNPSDIMPIAFENEISLNCMGELDDDCVYWEASSGYPLRRIERKTPLRAICELFILMNQGEKS